MGNVISSLFNRFVCSRSQSNVDVDGDDVLEEEEVEYDESELNNENSDSDDDLLTDDESWSGMDSFVTTDDSSDDGGGVTEGVGDRDLEQNESEEAEDDESDDDESDQDQDENGRGEDKSVREGGRCLAVERQTMHGLQERMPDGRWLCICGVTCASYKNHRRHVDYASGNGKFGCAYCPKVFIYLWYLNQHQKQAHNLAPEGEHEEKTYACRDCTLKFSSMSRLLLHRKTKHDNSGRSDNCEQGENSGESGEQPIRLRPDSSTAGHKRRLSARKAAKGQPPKKRLRTLPGIPQEEQPSSSSSSNNRGPPSVVEPEPNQRCNFCNKNLRGWDRDFMLKNWDQFDFCCHESVHSWMMKI